MNGMSFSNNHLLVVVILSICVNVSVPVFAQGLESAPKSLDGFASTRTEILTMIGGATQNIRVATDFLSDGEIVSALYVAQYRKVNVQVLLGPARATHVLSRLSYLKAQNIPVWLRPRGFMSQYSTLIQADQKLYSLDAELDYMARHRKFTLSALPDTHLKGFVEEFEKAQTTGISPTARAMPLVGRPGQGHSAYRGGAFQGSQQGGGLNQGNGGPMESGADPNGSYRYSRNKERPSKGVATKLPRNTILQNRTEKPPVLPLESETKVEPTEDVETVH